VVNTRILKDPQAAGWSSNTSQMVSKLSKYGYQIGPNTLLKVMAGDNVGAKVDYYYDQPSNNPVGGNLLSNLITNFVNSINVAATTISVHGASTDISNNLQNTTGAGSLQNFIQNQNISSSGTPQAYLNIIFFDENFNFVPLGSTGTRVTNSGNAQNIPMQVSQAPKNGYVFVYVSNESATPVFFDNLELYHTRGRLVEENTFYPYGLKIAALSSKAFDAPKNLYQYQGDYAEFDEESGYNEFELRDYDAQIGRFVQADPYEQFANPYTGMGNDPVNSVDEDGGWSGGLTGMVIGAVGGAAAGYFIAKNNGASKGGAIAAGFGGALVGAGLGYGVGSSLSGGGSFLNETRAFYKGLFKPSSSGTFIGEGKGSIACWTGSAKAIVPDLWGWVGNISFKGKEFFKVVTEDQEVFRWMSDNLASNVLSVLPVTLTPQRVVNIPSPPPNLDPNFNPGLRIVPINPPTQINILNPNGTTARSNTPVNAIVTDANGNNPRSFFGNTGRAAGIGDRVTITPSVNGGNVNSLQFGYKIMKRLRYKKHYQRVFFIFRKFIGVSPL
jgi:RHS repeat-associated protein